MSTVTATHSLPRIILYHQTIHDHAGNLVSILPLLKRPGISITHLIVAAIHINEDPDGLTLNDHPPSDPRFAALWAEVRAAQASGVTVMGMLGGAAKGSYKRLDLDVNDADVDGKAAAAFEHYYAPLAALVRERGLQGLDLDVEEEMSLAGIVRLVDRLRADFGPEFIITLAPVATALLDAQRNLSGFDYAALEAMRGPQIAWYNAQFYCGWGDASNPVMYDLICAVHGWPAEKVVLGLVTTPENGAGWVPFEFLGPTLKILQAHFPRFGGVMGWEYFNCRPGGQERPWEWAEQMTRLLRATEASSSVVEVDPDDTDGKPDAGVPGDFDYYSSTSDSG